MRLRHSTTTAALCCLLAACTVSTPGSQATPQGQNDCAAAAARRFKQPANAFRTDGSAITTSADVYEVRLTNTSTGQRVKCTVDQNGIVTDLIELR
jgi:hypothetical protein